jgi:hypothetical protein
MPDAAKAKLAAVNIDELLDRESKINYLDTKGQVLKDCKGKADLVRVSFSYPTRPANLILNGLEVFVI